MNAGRLLVIGTPIGNLSDLSPRAREAFAAADLIAAEDTRRTGLLLQHLGLKKPFLSYQHRAHFFPLAGATFTTASAAPDRISK